MGCMGLQPWGLVFLGGLWRFRVVGGKVYICYFEYLLWNYLGFRV